MELCDQTKILKSHSNTHKFVKYCELCLWTSYQQERDILLLTGYKEPKKEPKMEHNEGQDFAGL